MPKRQPEHTHTHTAAEPTLPPHRLLRRGACTQPPTLAGPGCVGSRSGRGPGPKTPRLWGRGPTGIAHTRIIHQRAVGGLQRELGRQDPAHSRHHATHNQGNRGLGPHGGDKGGCGGAPQSSTGGDDAHPRGPDAGGKHLGAVDAGQGQVRTRKKACA